LLVGFIGVSVYGQCPDGTTPSGISKSHAIGVFEVRGVNMLPESVKNTEMFSMQ